MPAGTKEKTTSASRAAPLVIIVKTICSCVVHYSCAIAHAFIFSFISLGLDCLIRNRPDVQLFNNNWNLAPPPKSGEVEQDFACGCLVNWFVFTGQTMEEKTIRVHAAIWRLEHLITGVGNILTCCITYAAGEGKNKTGATGRKQWF